MPKYTLQYFTLKALGEPIRLLLSYGNQEFEDIRIGFDDWPKYKDSTPFGQMPVLTIDGKKYAESTAISRFLGKEYGLGGANNKEDLEIDMHVDFIHDIRLKAAAAAYEKDETIQKQKYEDLKNIIPQLFSKLDGIIASNNGHIALGKLTWGDIYLAGIFDYLKYITRITDLEKQYPNISKVVQKVEAIPQVKKYVEKRPVTEA